MSVPKYLLQNKNEILSVFSREASTKVNIRKWQDFFQANPVAYAALSFLDQKYGLSIHRPQCEQLAKQALSRSSQDLFRYYLAVMIWGWGNQGRGKYFTKMGMNDPDIYLNLVSMIDSLKKDNLSKAYSEFRVRGCGSAYFTKLFYFIGKALSLEPLPIILDANLARSLQHIDKTEGTQYLNTFCMYDRDEKDSIIFIRRYLEGYICYVNTMDSWANSLGCTADQIESFMYRERGTDSKGNCLLKSKRVSIISDITEVEEMSGSFSTSMTTYPIRIPGVLKLAHNDPTGRQWEFVLKGSKYIRQLPEIDYPCTWEDPDIVTGKKRRTEGKKICCTFDNTTDQCTGCYHRRPARSPSGPGFYIGTPGINSVDFNKWIIFLKRFGVSYNCRHEPVDVMMTFDKNNVVEVSLLSDHLHDSVQ